MEGEFELYKAFGGMDGCRRLSAAFYARVERDPLLGPLFPSLHCAIEAFTVYLAQFLGGPCEYSERRWWLSLREAHLRFKIGRKERDAWMNNMRKALDDAEIAEPMRSALHGFFERSSAYMVNRGESPRASEKREAPPEDGIHQDIARRWDAHRAIEETVAAIRKGDGDRAVALVESPLVRTGFERDRAGFLSLLALMSGSREAVIEDYARQRLLGDPGLAQERYTSGRTLLHGASGAGSLATVELLLSLGADPNAEDWAGYTPLDCVGNECSIAGGGEVVRALVRGGANVDAQGGVKHCAALHMAARRGNVEVAEALLDCGADIEARDSKGETPLRRAVNCGKTAVAALLVARGADLHSKGSRGLTPIEAARTAAMKALLESYRR